MSWIYKRLVHQLIKNQKPALSYQSSMVIIQKRGPCRYHGTNTMAGRTDIRKWTDKRQKTQCVQLFRVCELWQWEEGNEFWNLVRVPGSWCKSVTQRERRETRSRQMLSYSATSPARWRKHRAAVWLVDFSPIAAAASSVLQDTLTSSDTDTSARTNSPDSALRCCTKSLANEDSSARDRSR